jgi:hypothetical protein
MEEIKYIKMQLANTKVIFTPEELKAFFKAIAPLVEGECKQNGTYYKFVKTIEHATYEEQAYFNGERIETGKELAKKQGVKFECLKFD